MSKFHYCVTGKVRPYSVPACSTCRPGKSGKEFDPVSEITRLQQALGEIANRDCESDPECHQVLSRQYWCPRCIVQEVLR